MTMLQQVKQLETFFRNEVNEDRISRGTKMPNKSMDSGETMLDDLSTKEVEMLRKEIDNLRKELKGKR